MNGPQCHDFLIFDSLFEILVNMTFSNLPFRRFFIDSHDTIFDRHKAQFLKYLNHLDQQDLLDIEISRQILQLVANIKLWKLVNGLVQFSKLLSGPITC